MLEAVYDILILFLSLAGVTFLIRMIYIWFLLPKNAGNQFYVVLLKDESCENDLRNAIQFSKEVGGRYCKKVICVDAGLDGESLLVFDRFAKEYHNLYLCPVDRLAYYLKNEMHDGEEK